MEPVSKRKEMEVKSVWANGQDVIGPIETVSTPTGELPYWKITLKDGNLLHITGQVIVKWGPKVYGKADNQNRG